MENGQFPKKDIVDRTFKFSVRVVRVANALPKTPVGFAFASQVVRSGTSISANVQEAQDALSRKDFTHSINIALKEARETEYWLRIITEAAMIPKGRLIKIIEENIELIKILTAIVKKAKKS